MMSRDGGHGGSAAAMAAMDHGAAPAVALAAAPRAARD